MFCLMQVTRKLSLITAAAALPATFSAASPGAHLPAYVTRVTPAAVNVRFLGKVTARAGLPQLCDTFISDARTAFSVGQSVRAVVVTVEPERRRLAVSLKPSATGNGEVEYLTCLLQDLELANKLHQQTEAAAAAAEGGEGEEAAAEPVDWSLTFQPGSLALEGCIRCSRMVCCWTWMIIQMWWGMWRRGRGC